MPARSASRPLWAALLGLLWASAHASGAPDASTRAYRSLWSGLFRSQAGPAPAAADAADRWRGALAEAQAWLAQHDPLPHASGGPQAAGLSHEPGTAGSGDADGSSPTASLLARLAAAAAAGDEGPADAAQLAATVATLQAWTVAHLLSKSSAGGSSSGISTSGGGSSAAASLAGGLTDRLLGQVQDPSWPAFKPHACVRMQNFGNAEGYNAALLGAASCAAAAPGTVAATGDALRWGGTAAFTLDCSHGHAGGDGSTAADGGGSGTLTGALHAAAASVAAALDRRSVCRLAVTPGAGAGGALLEREYEAATSALGGPKLDALRIRLCNLPPSTQQYPALLARGGAAAALSDLKLNGRPLLAGRLQASQADAADGCLLQLHRLPSRATRGGSFVLTGWLHLAEGGGGGSGSGTGGAFASDPSSGGGAFGVGEMASLELSLGEYSLLGAASSRLLGAMGGGGGAAAAAE